MFFDKNSDRDYEEYKKVVSNFEDRKIEEERGQNHTIEDDIEPTEPIKPTIRKVEREEDFSLFEYHKKNYEDSKRENSSKKALIYSLLGVGLLGVVGYFGYNSLSSDSSKTIVAQEINSTFNQENMASSSNISSQNNGSSIAKKDESHNNTHNIVAMANSLNKVDAKKELVHKKEHIKEVKEVSKSTIKVEKIAPKRNSVVHVAKKETKNKSSRVVTIKKGDTLATLAEKYYGNPMDYKIILRANPQINRHHLKIGQKIRIPLLDKKSRVHKNSTNSVNKRYRVVTIKKGDTLATLAEKYYGNPMDYKIIRRANPQIKRHHLKIGQKIKIPILDAKKQRRMVRIRKGDTLRSIAKRYYGSESKYTKIIKANYKIKDEHTPLHIGEKIYVPK